MRKNTALNAGCSLILLLALALGFGCAPKSRGLSDSTAEGYGSFGSQESVADRRARDYLAAEKSDPRGRDVLISTAKTALGTPYVRGGTSTDGFDCSGFVQWTFNQVGVKLPRTAREQSRVGKAIRDVDDVQVGDIVAFHHPKRGYHTGIYVGDGKFIHSPRKRTRVRINSMDDPYFSKTFMGARRIGVSSPEDIEAAERMLAEYREKEVSRTRSRDNGRSTAVARADNKRSKKESVRSSRSGKNKDSASSRRSSSGKSASKDSKDNKSKKSLGQARPPASQAVARADRSARDNDRAASRGSSTKQSKSDSSKKSSSKKSADTKSSTKASATKTGSSQKKGS